MKRVSLFSLLALALGSAGAPATAQYSGRYGTIPGVLVNRIITLSRPVDVALRESSVRQVAETLSTASGVPVHVDPQVPQDIHLSVTARHAPLGLVIEEIARQTGLFIAPEPHALVLIPSPSIEVNGHAAALPAPFAPWSNEWGLNPAASPFSGTAERPGGTGGSAGGGPGGR